jgi:hypothetical protein
VVSPVLKELLGALSVILAVAAYAIYAWLTSKGDARPHPLSWLIFGILTATGYWVQLDAGAGPGSWVMGVTAAISFMLAGLSVAKGKRTFPWYEWTFLFAAGVVFLFYLSTKQPSLSAVLATAVDVPGYGPTLTKAWKRPYSDSITNFALNSAKFVPSLFAMETVSRCDNDLSRYARHRERGCSDLTFVAARAGGGEGIAAGIVRPDSPGARSTTYPFLIRKSGPEPPPRFVLSERRRNVEGAIRARGAQARTICCGSGIQNTPHLDH